MAGKWNQNLNIDNIDKILNLSVHIIKSEVTNGIAKWLFDEINMDQLFQ